MSRDAEQEPQGEIEALIERWQAGDRSAGDLLFREHYPELLQYARRLFPEPLRRRADTVDVVQDACTAAWESRGRFRYRGTRSFAQWLFAILENRLWKRWRAEKAQLRDISKARPLVDSARVDPSQERPSEQLSVKEDLEKLESAVRNLPARHRRVVEARYLEDKSWDAIARESGKSKEASQMLLLRALRKLQGFFEI